MHHPVIRKPSNATWIMPMNFSGLVAKASAVCTAKQMFGKLVRAACSQNKASRWIAAIFASSFAILGVYPECALAQTSTLDSVVQREGDAFIRNGKADGLSIAIVQNGQTKYFNFGTVVRGSAKPPTQDTVYEIGSISKTFGSLLLAHAVVEKKVGASDDIRRYLPGTYANLQYQGTPIALSDLVATTSALPDNLPDFMPLLAKLGPAQAPVAIMNMLEHYSTGKLLQDLQNVQLSYKPGTEPAHSNVAPELLGVILEKVYGRAYQDLLATYIEKPAGMQSGVAKNRLPQMAHGYMVGDKAMPLISTLDFILPAGGLRYSASDMSKYVALQLNESDPAVALTHQVLWGDPGKEAIGFNWTITRSNGGKTRLSHSGGTFGFSSFVDLYPAAHYGIVLLANRSGPSTQDELEMLSDQIAHQVLGKSGMSGM
jgi:serine-type D-Ala-D-Ala carboxypeptidase/endopeptidase